MTRRSYSDLSAVSDGGQYRFEARSPENGTIPNRDGSIPEVKPDYLQCFQSNFRFQLIDQGSEKVIWEKWELARHPTGLCVSEDGWSVVFCDSTFQSYSPDCKLTCTVKVEPESLRERVITSKNHKYNRPGHGFVFSQYVQLTTAGAIWETASLRYFVECHGRPHFICRTGWGDRIVVDVENGLLVENDEVTSIICAETEKRFTRSYVEAVANEIRLIEEQNCLDEEQLRPLERWPELHGVLATLLWLGCDHVAKDDLTTILFLSEIGVSSTLGGLKGKWTVFKMDYRTLIKLAFRMCGSKPCEMGSYCFGHYVHDGSSVRSKEFLLIEMPNPVESRDSHLSFIEQDMTIKQVVEKIGAPDSNDSYLVNVCDETFKRTFGIKWEYFYGTGAQLSSMIIKFRKKDDQEFVTEVFHQSPVSREYLETRIAEIIMY